MITIKVYTKKEKEEYAKWLIETFGGKDKAILVIDELLKCVGDGSDKSDLKETKKILLSMDDKGGINEILDTIHDNLMDKGFDCYDSDDNDTLKPVEEYKLTFKMVADELQKHRK